MLNYHRNKLSDYEKLFSCYTHYIKPLKEDSCIYNQFLLPPLHSLMSPGFLYVNLLDRSSSVVSLSQYLIHLTNIIDKLQRLLVAAAAKLFCTIASNVNQAFLRYTLSLGCQRNYNPLCTQYLIHEMSVSLGSAPHSDSSGRISMASSSRSRRMLLMDLPTYGCCTAQYVQLCKG